VSLDPEFDDLKREFLSEAEEKIREIESLVSDSAPKEARDRMIYLAHQLKGAGGSYGFPSISADAAALESALEKMNEGARPDLRHEVVARLQSLNRAIETQRRELGAA
jgi:HPt (histidine-containing phosphotransfer) domain-containing protein